MTHWSDDTDSHDVRHTDPDECAALMLERDPCHEGRTLCMHAYTAEGYVVETRDIDVSAWLREQRGSALERMGEPRSAGVRHG